MIHPVILCGGSGTRLWPVSRKSYPKQFSRLTGTDSLYQQTLKRLSGPGFAAPVVLTNSEFRFIATEQLSEAGLSAATILIEPESRNTAPAVLCAALSLERDPEALMLVAPSDHVIADTETFRDALDTGCRAARTGRLVTFGIRPDRPETGYGYLETGPLLDLPAVPPASSTGETAGGAAGGGVTTCHPPHAGTRPRAHALTRFVEKPDTASATEMLARGGFLWNAGIFLFRVRDILAAFRRHAPELVAPCRAALREGREDLCFFRLGEQAFAECQDISVDYAVMEPAGAEGALAVVPYDGGWSDLGAWDAVWRELGPDDAGVATRGPVTALDCNRVLLRSEDENIRLVGLGLRNIAAIAMRDAVLVADLDASQNVGAVVAALRREALPQAETFPRCHRPWGWYETLIAAPRFQVKRIMVHPGAKLSLQSHVHRAEHWVVVAGTARVTVGEEVVLVSENQSIFVPLGARHRLENPGRVEMHLIEVQTGAYLGEDDITRYEDIYARG